MIKLVHPNLVKKLNWTVKKKIITLIPHQMWLLLPHLSFSSLVAFLTFFWSISLRKIHFDVASLSQKRITYPNLCLVKVDGQDFLQSTKLLASNVHSSRRFWSSQHLLSTIGVDLTSRFTFFRFHFLSDPLSPFYLLLEVISRLKLKVFWDANIHNFSIYEIAIS